MADPAERKGGRVRPEAGAETVAVIDIGSNAVRMAVAQLRGDRVEHLESLNQPVNLGRDTFTGGSIGRETMEDCVSILRGYQRVLLEYGVDRPDRIRAVATSAVREAGNRLQFLDRVEIGTGIRVEPIDEAEVNRLVFMCVNPLIQGNKKLAGGRSLVVEVGGGSTELLLVHKGGVAQSLVFHLGSLRLHEMMESMQAPAESQRRLMQSHIDRTVELMKDRLPRQGMHLVAIGGDARFAAEQLKPSWADRHIARLSVSDLEELTHCILEQSVDDLVLRYRMSYPDAETIGPALAAYVALARALERKTVYVTDTNLRDGLLAELSLRGAWPRTLVRQVERSALAVARQYGVDQSHARHVARLAEQLFDALQEAHQLDERYRMMLRTATILHDIGLFISNQSHHKHSMYLIRNSQVFGLGQHELLLVALIARYHRRAMPKPTHEGYADLARGDRLVVLKLASILRVADALDRTRRQRVRRIECEQDGEQLVLTLPDVADVTLEQMALEQKGPMFERTYGMTVVLRGGAADAGA